MKTQENSIQEPRTYQWVDVFKFFFCICIIAMHSNIPLPGIYWIEKLLYRLAVPFFFVVSGFFLSKSCRERGTGAAVKRYCVRLLKLLVAFSVIWIIQFWIDCAISKTSLADALFQTGQHILFLPNNGLWYIQASIVGALLLIPFFRSAHIIAAVVTGFVLYEFALLCNNYYFLIQDTALQLFVDGYTMVFLAPHNGVFVGLLFLALGALTERYLQNYPYGVPRVLLAISYVLYVAEIISINRYATKTDDGAFYLMLVFVAPLLLTVLVQLQGHFDPTCTLHMRHLSTGMYLLHLPLMWCYHRFRDYILPQIPMLRHGQGILMNGGVKFMVIVLLSLSICQLAYLYTNKLKRYLM